MRRNADLAIVIPAYNAAATIQETLSSIQTQTDLSRVSAVYLADDASADDTVEAARSCWTSDVPLVISANARNRGERATVNDLVGALPDSVNWFLILHADDTAKRDWIAVMAGEADNADLKVISITASYDVLFEDGRIVPGEDFGLTEAKLIEGTPRSIRATLERGCWFKVSSCAIRVAGFRQLGGFKTDMPQLGDWEFVLRALEAGCKIEYVPMCLSTYRQHQQSVSSRSFREHRDVHEALRILREYRRYLPRVPMIRRHLFYLNALARRSAKALLLRDFGRFRSGIILGMRVGLSLMKNSTAR
jgi:glycosyltransferase involved in cell wall biosynthesis